MRKYYLLLVITSLFMFGCDPSNPDDDSNPGVSDAEIIEGLKDALRVGTDTAVSVVSVTDGYFKDQAIKLLLPDELQNSINTFKAQSMNITGVGTLTGDDIWKNGVPLLGIASLQSKEDDLVLGINRAAESAAKTAAPIFWGAITDMTIDDGRAILFSDTNTTAATEYLNDKTRPTLFGNYEPKIDSTLKSIKIGSTSVVDEYESFVTSYNDVLNTSIPLTTNTISSLSGVNPVGATDLSEYSTNKGLDGLFLKVGEQEKKIREDPIARVTDILTKVFGLLD